MRVGIYVKIVTKGKEGKGREEGEGQARISIKIPKVLLIHVNLYCTSNVRHFVRACGRK